MKLKEPLTVVLITQLVVLMGAVGFMAGRAGGHPPAPTAKAEPHESEGVEELDDEQPAPKRKASEKKSNGKAEPHEEAPAPSKPEVAAEEPHAAAGQVAGSESSPAQGHPTPAGATVKADTDPHAKAPANSESAPAAPPTSEEAERHDLDGLISSLVAGNARFVEGVSRQRDLLMTRTATAADDSAKLVVVSCTDSRVVPEFLFDQPLGTFSVVRLPGAQLDAAGLKTVDAEVKRLGARAVLVLGHLGCSHLEHALKRADAQKSARPASLTAALGGLRGLPDEVRDEQVAAAAISFTARELQKRSKTIGRDVALLRLSYSPATGVVTWLDAQADPPPEPQPRAARR